MRLHTLKSTHFRSTYTCLPLPFSPFQSHHFTILPIGKLLMKACNYRLRPIKNNFAIGPKEVYIGRRRTYLLIDNGKKQVKRRKSLSESRTFTLYPRWTERSEGWREYGCKIDFRDNKSKSYSSLAVPPILRMYSFGVTPVLFLNERKKEARELKPQSSASAVKV